MVDENQRSGSPVLERVVCTTSRSPIGFDANSDAPSRSLAEHRTMSVLAHFSTIVSAAPSASNSSTVSP
ncbi:MAG TPA: hypothetical protein VGM84_02200 [Steroidobacteraceae bacterium]